MGVPSYPERTDIRFTPWRREPHSETITFGPFELNIKTGELRKYGLQKRLQQKSFLVLQTLLARPGELITRQELAQKLWPDGTFVDFESGLNTAINRLRSALDDSAEQPQYIETLPRLGYRFICPVTRCFSAGDLLCNPASPAEAPPLASVPVLPNGKKGTAPVSAFSAALLSLLVVAVSALAYLRSSSANTIAPPRFRQLTFRTGRVLDARFVPSCEKISYLAVWQDGIRRTYLLDLQNLNPTADGAVADRLPQSHVATSIRIENTESVIEFPSGHIVYRSQGWISDLRVSPQGDQVAFFEHPVRDDDGGYLRVVDKKGKASLWTPFWSSAAGLAWSPSTGEIWFTAGKGGEGQALYAASEPGKMRLISQNPSSLRLLDLSRKGQALIALDNRRMDLMVWLSDKRTELDLSKFDSSHADDISPDGRFVLFTESSSNAGKHYSSYLYDVSSRTTRLLTQGRGLALSPDANWVLTIDPEDRRALTLNARQGGKARRIDGDGFEYQWARFLPDGNELLVGGAFPGEPLIIARQNITGGRPKAVKGVSYMDYVAVSPDGNQLAGFLNGQTTIFDLSQTPVVKTPINSKGLPVAWSKDSRVVYITRPDRFTTELVGYMVDSGRVEHWKTIPSSSTSGFVGLASMIAAPQSGNYAYSRHLDLSRLYLVEGWH